MQYQLIAMDLDGTLNNDEKRITPRTRVALMRAQDAGIRLALASARPLPGLYRERDALEIQRHRGILMAYMTLEEARRMLRALESLPVTPILDDGVQFYVTDRSAYKVEYECWNNNMTCTEVSNLADFIDFAPAKILMSLQPEILPEVQSQIAALLPDSLAVVRTAAFYLEIIPRAVNKGQGLRDICRVTGIAPEAAIAFGDSENDIEMLRAAGVGIAMGNADDGVKAVANQVTRSNNEDGIAAALEQLLGWPAKEV